MTIGKGVHPSPVAWNSENGKTEAREVSAFVT